MPAVLGLIGAVLSISAFFIALDWDRQKIQNDFQHAAENHFVFLKKEIEIHLHVLLSIKALYSAEGYVDRQEFRNFVKPSLLHHSDDIQALEWIPRITELKRSSYEAAAQNDGFPDFQIKEIGAHGKMVRANRRKEYFPVYFVEPYKGNEIALGFNLASDPERTETLERACDTGEMVASGRIKLVQEKTGQFGILVFAPVYKEGEPVSVESRRENLQGFVLGVFRIGDVLKQSTSDLKSEGIDIHLFDISAPQPEQFLYSNLSHTEKTTVASKNHREYFDNKILQQYVGTLDVAGRKWQALFILTPDYIAKRKTWQPWLILFTGILFTGLIVNYISSGIRHARYFRTTNEQLMREIAEHKKMDDILYWDVQVNSALEELAKLILQYSSIDEISRLVLDCAKRFTKSPKGYIGYIPLDSSRLISSLFSPDVANSCDFPGGEVVFLGTEGYEWVLAHKKSLLTNDSANDLRVSRAPESQFPICRYLSAPSLIGDTLVGLITLADADADYGEADLAVTERFASLYALAIDHIRSQTALARKNEELEKAYAGLKAAQSHMLQQEKMASIGQLAAGVAHEINNPVGFITSNLGSLQKYAAKLTEFISAQSDAIAELTKGGGASNAEQGLNERKKALKIDYIIEDLGNLIKESLDGADRVKKIVQDLKGFSRFDEAEHKIADINSGLDSTINIVWNELKYKAKVKRDYGNLPMIKCNLGQLNQVFMNILVNASHAIEKQGEITVKTWSDEDYIFVSISDTGSGIPEDKISRIFEPFFTTKEVGKGTGLGLSIAYDIVKKHNGDMEVESVVGKGTTFTIKIPLIEADSADPKRV